MYASLLVFHFKADNERDKKLPWVGLLFFIRFGIVIINYYIN